MIVNFDKSFLKSTKKLKNQSIHEIINCKKLSG